jgi:ribosome-binding protein aMBF1 (putative translation factor)
MKKVDCKKCSNFEGAVSKPIEIEGKQKTQWFVDCAVFREVKVIGGGDIIWKYCSKYDNPNEAKKVYITSESKRILRQEIGARIRKIRKELGLTQAELVAKSKRKCGVMSRIELGEVSPRLELLISLYRDYNVNINYVLVGEGEMFRPDRG